MQARTWRLLLLLGWLLGGATAAWAKGAVVWVVLGGTEAVSMEAVEGLRRALPDQQLVIRAWNEFAARPAPPPRAMVAVGAEAAQRLLAAGDPAWPRVPVVAMLLSRSVLEALPLRGERPATGVYLDQPFERQFALLRAAVPEWGRVGVLLGPDSQRYRTELQQAARSAGLKLATEVVADPDQLATSLQAVLGDSEVLLSVPDALVYNGNTAQNILRSAYRQRTPLLGYSAAFVRAGALMGIYTTPEQAGRQGGELVTRVLAGQLPPLQPPRDFQIAVNANVGRSLGMSLDEASLNRQLRQSAGPAFAGAAAPERRAP